MPNKQCLCSKPDPKDWCLPAVWRCDNAVLKTSTFKLINLSIFFCLNDFICDADAVFEVVAMCLYLW